MKSKVFAVLVLTLTVGFSSAPVSAQTVDGQFDQTGALVGGATFNLTVLNRGGVPAVGVGSVALNVTVASPTNGGYVTVWPAGQAQPNASNLNFEPGQTVPNMVIVKVGAAGQISIFNSAGLTDLLVDVLGWFPTGASFTGLTPARLMDTRIGGSTVDGTFAGSGPLSGGSTVNLTVLNRGAVPAAGVGSVALNVTAVSPSAGGYVTVWPKGGAQPNASNLNFQPGQTVPNMVIVKVGAGGQISLFNSAGSTDLIVDVLGWFPTGASFTGLTPARLMDTRITGTTVDGTFANGGRLSGGSTFNLTVLNRGSVPAAGVGSVALNVTVDNPSAVGYATVWPTGDAQPNASNLNFVPGQTVPNMVIVKVGAGGQISLFNSAGSTDLIVDVLGWFPTGASFTGLTPARLMDTRVPPPTPSSGAIQAVYVIPADVAPVAGRAAAIRTTVTEVQNWFDAQTGGRHPVFTRNGSTISVLSIVLPYTQQQIAALGARRSGCSSACEVQPIADYIHQVAPFTVGQRLVIELEGYTAMALQGACGYAPAANSALIIPMKNCGIFPTADAFPYGGTYLVAHELTHMLGAVQSCAPHADGSGHVNDDPRDVLYSGALSRDWEHLMLDPGHDDYYLSPCGDISGNALLGTG